MKALRTITIAMAGLMLVVAASTPADAACGGAVVYSSKQVSRTYVTNPSFPIVPGPYGFSNCYVTGQPRISPNLDGFFWALGDGCPEHLENCAGVGGALPGIGIDNGTYAPAADIWLIKAGGSIFAPSYGYYNAPYIFGNWTNAAIDNCFLESGATNACDNTECQCLVIEDQDATGTGGFFLLASRLGGGGCATDFTMPGVPGGYGGFCTDLSPIPAPNILASASAGNNVDLDLDIPVLSAIPDGVYHDPSGQCDACDGEGGGGIRYRVYSVVQPRGTGDPTTRTIAGTWTAEPMRDPGDNTTPIVDPPSGTAVRVTANCAAADEETYLAVQLVFESGFQTSIVGFSSLQIDCGTNLADPDEEPQRRPRIQRVPSGGRGR